MPLSHAPQLAPDFRCGQGQDPVAAFAVGLVQQGHEALLFPALLPAWLHEGELEVVLRHEAKTHDPNFLIPAPLTIEACRMRSA